MSWRQTQSLILFTALLFVAMPAAARAASDFATAQALLRDGRPAEALVMFEELKSAHPNDVDYAFAVGQALARLGRDAEASAELAHAIALSPQYEAVWREQHTVLKRLADPAELTRFRQQATAQFPDANWWRVSRDSPQNSWTVLIGAGADHLSDGFPAWNNQFAELQYDRSESQRFGLRLARDERNRQGDLSTGVTATFTGTHWFGGGAVTLASSPAFQSRTAVELHAGRSLPNGWVASASARRRGYDSATVSGITAKVERYFGAYRIAYAIGHSRLHAASGFTNHGLSGNWYYAESSSLGLSLSSGREAEAIGDGRVLQTDVRGAALSGRHYLNPRFSLHWWLGVHEQGDLYRRRFLGLAVSFGI